MTNDFPHPHDPAHEAVLRRALFDGTTAGDDVALERLLAECAECRDEWDEVQGGAALVKGAADRHREDMEAVATLGHVPGEERLEAAVRRLGGARDRRPARRRLMVAAAALVVVGLATALFLRADRSGTDDPVILGPARVACVAPTGTVDPVSSFRWEGRLPAGGFYRVVVFDAAEAEVLESPATSEDEWVLTEDQRATLPSSFSWEVTVRDGSGLPRAADRAEVVVR